MTPPRGLASGVSGGGCRGCHFLRWTALLLLGLFLAWRAPGWLEGRQAEIQARAVLTWLWGRFGRRAAA